MSNYSPRLVEKLNALANEYSGIIMKSVTDVLNTPRYRNTGLGAASVSVQVVAGDAQKAPNIILQFDDRLIFLEKKKMQWTKLPNIEKLMEWATAKLPGDEKGAKKLAWAVAWDKKKNDTWKRKRWTKASLGTVLREMNQMIVQGFDKAIEEDMQAAASA
jgi:hypothetical protein